jgi:hypothetical protein
MGWLSGMLGKLSSCTKVGEVAGKCTVWCTDDYLWRVCWLVK